jgi:cell wall-associated NlpC family hydrolase
MSVAPATRVAMVWPPRATVSRGLTPLRGAADDGAELVDEAQYGELMTCLGTQGEWTYVQGPDLYFGWIRTTDLMPYGTPQAVVIGVPLAPVYPSASADASVVDEIPAGAPIVFREPAGDWWRIGVHPDRYVRVEHTVAVATLPQRFPTADDLLATAESFFGVPYLWGGTSTHGIDCSGFTQRVYRLNGVGLDRDADQQALGGRPVDVACPGDLFFFGKDRVTHTAIATGERTFIHAPESGKIVQRGELTDPERLRAIRRYLP